MKKLLITLLLVCGSLNAQILTMYVAESSTDTLAANNPIDTSGSSRVYFVDALYGDDGNDGESGLLAWKTWDNFSGGNGSSFGAGDTILFRRGQTFARTDASSFFVTHSDTVYFGAYGTGAKPILDGEGEYALRSGYNGQSIGCTFENIKFATSDSTDYHLVADHSSNPGHNFIFNNCEFDGTNVADSQYTELFNWFGDNLTVSNSTFENSYDDALYVSGEASGAGGGTIVENCTFTNIKNGGAVKFNHDADGGIVRRNTMTDVNYGVIIGGGDSIIVHHNLISIHDTTQVRSGFHADLGDAPATESENVKVYNNTILLDGHAYPDTIAFVRIKDASGTNWDVQNNLVYLTGSGHFYHQEDATVVDPTFDYNLYFGEGVWQDSNGDSTTSFADWQSSWSQDANGDSTIISPFASGSYELNDSTVAVNAGATGLVDWSGNSIYTSGDIDGDTLVGTPDIGAYESAFVDTVFYDACDADNAGDWRTGDCTVAFDTDHYEVTYTAATQHAYNDGLLAKDGVDYTMRAYVKDGTTASVSGRMMIHTGLASTGTHGLDFTTTSEWQLITLDFTASGAGLDTFNFYTTMTGAGNYEIKDVLLVER